jgi:hypothetical protein
LLIESSDLSNRHLIWGVLRARDTSSTAAAGVAG